MAETEQPNWHIDPQALKAYYELSGIQPISEEGAIRVQPTFGEAEGYREVFELYRGFQLVTGDLTCHKEAVLTMKSDGSLKFHYRLEGFSGLELSDRRKTTSPGTPWGFYCPQWESVRQSIIWRVNTNARLL